MEEVELSPTIVEPSGPQNPALKAWHAASLLASLAPYSGWISNPQTVAGHKLGIVGEGMLQEMY